jgi:hypothetical protein
MFMFDLIGGALALFVARNLDGFALVTPCSRHPKREDEQLSSASI